MTIDAVTPRTSAASAGSWRGGRRRRRHTPPESRHPVASRARFEVERNRSRNDRRDPAEAPDREHGDSRDTKAIVTPPAFELRRVDDDGVDRVRLDDRLDGLGLVLEAIEAHAHVVSIFGLGREVASVGIDRLVATPQLFVAPTDIEEHVADLGQLIDALELAHRIRVLAALVIRDGGSKVQLRNVLRWWLPRGLVLCPHTGARPTNRGWRTSISEHAPEHVTSFEPHAPHPRTVTSTRTRVRPLRRRRLRCRAGE